MEKIHPKLSKIKWIICFIQMILKKLLIKLAIKIINDDKNKKMIITDYQFISVFGSMIILQLDFGMIFMGIHRKKTFILIIGKTSC